MSNPFLEDGESTHEYNNQMFVVDFYPHPLGNTWQCSDSSHYIRARANTKQEAIDQAHKEWDEYKKIKAMTNNKEQTAVEWFLHKVMTFYVPDDLEEFEMFMEIVQQAKEMQKDQQIKSWETGLMKVDFNEYYKETYGEELKNIATSNKTSTDTANVDLNKPFTKITGL